MLSSMIPLKSQFVSISSMRVLHHLSYAFQLIQIRFFFPIVCWGITIQKAFESPPSSFASQQRQRRVWNSLSRTNSANIWEGGGKTAWLWWVHTRETALVFVSVHTTASVACVSVTGSCVATESRKSLWGRDKNGEAAPRTRSASTTPNPS